MGDEQAKNLIAAGLYSTKSSILMVTLQMILMYLLFTLGIFLGLWLATLFMSGAQVLLGFVWTAFGILTGWTLWRLFKLIRAANGVHREQTAARGALLRGSLTDEQFHELVNVRESIEQDFFGSSKDLTRISDGKGCYGLLYRRYERKHIHNLRKTYSVHDVQLEPHERLWRGISLVPPARGEPSSDN